MDEAIETDLSKSDPNPSERAEVRVERVKVRGRLKIALGPLSGEAEGEVDAGDAGGRIAYACAAAIVVGMSILAAVGVALTGMSLHWPTWVSAVLVGLVFVLMATLLIVWRRDTD
ncbi:MAG TPA: hypothetical protein VGL47_29900 [Amycolatopsis sp.]|uniref:Phage holin family protein n=1 Tax=Amycolatopsis nalaikhensis TaxID=715472 RepID=A0ABY8XVD6_9PSEU|nr:hypothetical protein [Amycolatopsis sp. 2-2]WIV59662.1 hypothetical protein QP939_14125 [Amycolatopsis sp. 2-2]